MSEGSHRLAVVVRDESLEEGDRSLHPLFRDEAEDADHGESAVVDLLNESVGLLLLRHIFVEAEGVVKRVERDGVGHGTFGEFGELPGRAASHVVSADGLREPFEEADEEEDLPLGGVAERVPLFGGGSGRGGEGGAVERDRPGEGVSVRLDDVPDEGGHCDATVLDFGVTEEGDGLVLAVSVDGRGGKLKGIVELHVGEEIGSK